MDRRISKYKSMNLFLARVCLDEIPEQYLKMDVIWPKKSRLLNTMITYDCPFRRGTTTQKIKSNISNSILILISCLIL